LADNSVENWVVLKVVLLVSLMVVLKAELLVVHLVDRKAVMRVA
jgi:hypothetical protein